MIRFTKAKPKPKPKKPKGSKKAALNKLKSFLAAAEPEAVEILLSNWQAQANAITYKELREAYLAGGITRKQFEKWQKDYAKLITSTLAPKWEQAANAAAAEVKAQYPKFFYEPSVSAGMAFIKQNGAELVTNLAQEQRDALNAVIAHVSGYTAVTPDEAARIIRPCVGLTKPQALANARYREAVKAAYLKQHPKGKPGTAEKKAAEAAARYAGRQHRYRAQNIARTELAFAYNAGAYGATKDAQRQGVIGDCVKVWMTAYDERVCPICAALDGEKKNMDEAFSTGKLLPPAHPSCRCAVAYEEIHAANLTIAPQDSTIDTQAQPPILPTGTVQRTESGYRISDMLNDLSVLPDDAHGAAIRSDGGMVEGLNLTGRRITIDNTGEYYEISGKLTEDAWEQAVLHASKHGHAGQMEFLLKDPITGIYCEKDVGMTLDCYRMETSQAVFEIYSDYSQKRQFGMGGYFRARVPVMNNAELERKALEDVFDKAGLRTLAADPTDAEELLLRKTRLAWQHDPRAMEQCRYITGTAREKEIDRILHQAGIDDKRVRGMTLKEVFPGYSTYVDDASLMEYKKAGLTHIWAGVEDANSVVAITQSDGFAATNYRITSGMKKCGASPGADMMTGGSDSVFTRLGIQTDTPYSYSYLGGYYRIIIDPAELTRTDWYAHTSDNFGVARSDDRRFQNRLDPVSFLKQMKKGYSGSNEIMFRHGISKEHFIGISCDNDRLRDILLDKYRTAGVSEINGVPIEDFITVSTKVGEDGKRGIIGISYYNTPF